MVACVLWLQKLANAAPITVFQARVTAVDRLIVFGDSFSDDGRKGSLSTASFSFLADLE